VSGDLGGVLLNLVQEVEGIHAAQLAGVNQAHVDVADASTVLSFVKQGIFPVQDRFLPILKEFRRIKTFFRPDSKITAI